MRRYHTTITNRILSLMLAFVLVISMLPMSSLTAFAAAAEAATDNLCEHHAEHTAECGYAEAVAGQACTHTHDTAVCGYVEAAQEVPCECAETDESGALVHTEGCGYVAPVTGADCTHAHDDTCGYVAAAPAHECHYACAACAEEDATQNQSADWCGNPLCSQEDKAHVTSCTQYVRPENPECRCVEKCGVENLNLWCHVCGIEGETACRGGADEGVPYEEDNASVYTVAGSRELCGSVWYPSDSNNVMTDNGDGTFSKTFQNVAVSDRYDLKVFESTADGTGTWYGTSDDSNITFAVSAVCDVTVTIDAVTKKITVTGSGVEEVVFRVDYVIAAGNGDETWLNGANWDPTDLKIK